MTQRAAEAVAPRRTPPHPGAAARPAFLLSGHSPQAHAAPTSTTSWVALAETPAEKSGPHRTPAGTDHPAAKSPSSAASLSTGGEPVHTGAPQPRRRAPGAPS